MQKLAGWFKGLFQTHRRTEPERPISVSAGDRKLLGAIALFSAVVCTYAMRQADPDLWGHLAYGRLFLAQGTPTVQDPFAYTSSGFQWVAFEYLAQILLWAAYRSFGPLGLIALKCLVGGVTLYLLYVAIRATTDDIAVYAPVFVLCASTIARFFTFRPQLFTFLFFSLFVALVVRFLTCRQTALWILPVAMLVWANLHGGFFAGFAVLGLAVFLRVCENVTDGWRNLRTAMAGTGPLWITTAACILATFVNPWGWRLWLYVLTEVFHGTNRHLIAEWRPPSLGGDTWSMLALTLMTVILMVVGWIAERVVRKKPGPRPLYWVASCAPAIVLGYTSVRHIPLVAIWAGPVIALIGSRIKQAPSAVAGFRLVWFGLSTFAYVAIFLTLTFVAMRPRPTITIAGAILGSRHPCRAAAFLRRNHLMGNVYAPLWWGSYLTWELYPSVRVSMDGRNISLFPDDMIVENLNFYSAVGSHADLAAPLRYKTDMLLVPSDTPVLPLLLQDARWYKAYVDSDSVLLVRADPVHQSLLSLVKNDSLALPSEPCPEVLQ